MSTVDYNSALTAIKISPAPAAPAAEATAADSCLLSVLSAERFYRGWEGWGGGGVGRLGGGGEGVVWLLVSFVRIKHIVYNNVIGQLLIKREESLLSINTKHAHISQKVYY